MNLFTKIWQSAVILSLFLAPLVCAKVTIYMLGDSTMETCKVGWYPRQGQGQDFQYWFDVNLALVENRGLGGMSLGGGELDKKGNIAVGYYDAFFKNGCNEGNCIAEKLKAGDYVVVQFGINDINYSNEDFFRTNMIKLVGDVRAKGAYPIIMSPIRRFYYDSPTQIHNSYRGYPALNQKLADSLGVPFIDMSELVANYMISVGEYYAQNFVFNYSYTTEYTNDLGDQSDPVHLQMNGANSFGRIITEQMRFHSNTMVRKLGDYMAPMYQVSVKVSPEGADSATSINAYYPKGMTVMLKTIPKNGKRFLGWYDGDGNKVENSSRTEVKSPYILTFVMGDKATQYTAVYEGGTAEKYTGDGKAMTAFPATTPKSLDDVVYVPFTPMEGRAEVDKNIKKFIDAYTPDEAGIGWSENEWEGFIGEGYYNFDNKNTSFATYQLKFFKAGQVTLAVRYANGGTSDRMFNVYLDQDYYISAPPTGGWDKWDTAYVVVNAPQGEAELKFMSLTGDGAPNIDAFGFNVDNVCRASESNCEVPEFISKRQDIGVGLGTVYVSVYDINGRLMARKVVENAANLSLSSMVSTPGLYRVVVKQGNSKFYTSFIKMK